MKIGIYSPYFDTFGGGERYILTIAEHLSIKHDVFIFSDDDLSDKAYNRLAIDLKRVKFVDNIFSSKHSLFKKLNITRQYDLLIFLSDGSIPLSLSKKNIIHFQRPFFKISIWNKLKIKKYNYVICNSLFTKKYIDRSYKVESLVAYPPVEINDFQPSEKKELIFSVGRFHPFKKQKEMILAFNKLAKKIPSWQFYLIGGLLDQDRNYFNQLTSLKKGVNVKMFPNESFANLQKYYSQAKIYWHAAGFGEDEKKHPERMEHFGISTVEAMASGCIPIVYDGGGQKEIVHEGQNGCLWRSTEELIKKTFTLAKNEKKRLTMQKKAIQDSKKFSLENFEKQIDKLVK